MKKIAFISSLLLFLVPIHEPKGQMVVNDPSLNSAFITYKISSQTNHAESISRMMQQLSEARKTVQGVKDVKNDLERTYNFGKSLVDLTDLRNIKTLNFGTTLECLAGFSLDPRSYMPRFNRNTNAYFVGCPSLEKAMYMVDDMSNLGNRYGWEKMMQQKQLMQSQYIKQLIEQMRATNETLEKQLAEEKNEMTKGEYLQIKMDIEKRMREIMEYENLNDKLVEDATQPTPIEMEIHKSRYQQTLLMQNLSFMMK